MALVNVAIPFRCVSISPTALNRRTAISHRVRNTKSTDGLFLPPVHQEYLKRPPKPPEVIWVYTACGRVIQVIPEYLSWQVIAYCEQCEKSSKGIVECTVSKPARLVDRKVVLKRWLMEDDVPNTEGSSLLFNEYGEVVA